MQKQSSKRLFKKSIINNFVEFTRKHLCRNLFFDKVKLYWSQIWAYQKSGTNTLGSDQGPRSQSWDPGVRPWGKALGWDPGVRAWSLEWDPGVWPCCWGPRMELWGGNLGWNFRVGPWVETLGWDPWVGPLDGTLGWETIVGQWSETLGWDSHVWFFNILNYNVFSLSELLEVQTYV